MKTFIHRIILFSIPLVLSMFIGLYVYHDKQLKVMAALSDISTYECLIMGDSQMQRINPQYFDIKTFNFASTGEHYYFTWQKLKKVIQPERSRLKHVILGVSIHNFSPFYKKLFDLLSPEGRSSLLRYFYFIDGDEFIAKKDVLRLSHLKPILLGKPALEGFKKSDHKHPDKATIDKALETHYGGADKASCLSQIKYLKEIVTLCRENNIRLYFVSTPYHPDYLKKIDAHYKNIFGEVLKSMGNVPHLNYLNVDVNTEHMSDGNHLNTEGAQKYSTLINQFMQNNT